MLQCLETFLMKCGRTEMSLSSLLFTRTCTSQEMTSHAGIFIVGAKRTAFGSFGGSLSRLRCEGILSSLHVPTASTPSPPWSTYLYYKPIRGLPQTVVVGCHEREPSVHIAIKIPRYWSPTLLHSRYTHTSAVLVSSTRVYTTAWCWPYHCYVLRSFSAVVARACFRLSFSYLADSATELAVISSKAALASAGLDPSLIDATFVGNAIQSRFGNEKSETFRASWAHWSSSFESTLGTDHSKWDWYHRSQGDFI